MLFNSWTFSLFYVAVFALYWSLGRRMRLQNLLLLGASYLFYGWWDVRFLSLIAVSTYVDYCTSILIDQGRLTRRQIFLSSAYLMGIVSSCTGCNWAAVFGNQSLEPFLSFELDRWWPSLGAAGFVALFLTAQRLPARFGRRLSPGYHLFWCASINLGVLVIFKYLGFFADSFTKLWAWFSQSPPNPLALHIVLPVGISFFTFQTLSHAIDVYRRKIPATESLVDLAAYIAFFPQLVAGPIERGAHLLPQFQRLRHLERDDLRSGMWLIFWGLYKKIVIADNVAGIVNATFGPYDDLSLTAASADGLRCLVAVYAFAVQIYCDFSGYTDIARGTAKLLGFDIMLNFDLPYLATTPSDFWQRWHISLSSWLRDYLYIPLGGNRAGKFRMYANLMTTMVLGGLWHGAAWTFVLWGVFHGGILVLYRLLGVREAGDTTPAVRWFHRFIMFHLVCFGWLLFRAQNMATVGLFLQSIFSHWQHLTGGIDDLRQLLFYSWFLIACQAWQAWRKDLDPLRNLPWFVQLNVWVFLIISLLRLSPGGDQEFIYFAF